MVNFMLALNTDTEERKGRWNPAVGLFYSSVHTAKHTHFFFEITKHTHEEMLLLVVKT